VLFHIFFQAEDGIRYRNVTGVQTCALPISEDPAARLPSRHHLGLPVQVVRRQAVQGLRRRGHQDPQAPVHGHGARWDLQRGDLRSEERRVGKEWSSMMTLYIDGYRGAIQAE